MIFLLQQPRAIRECWSTNEILIMIVVLLLASQGLIQKRPTDATAEGAVLYHKNQRHQPMLNPSAHILACNPNLNKPTALNFAQIYRIGRVLHRGTPRRDPRGSRASPLFYVKLYIILCFTFM